MLRAVGHPVAVNPDSELLRVAREEGWQVMTFDRLHRRIRIAAAAAGLGALVVRAQPVFQAIKWAGVAYLLWLGVQALRRRSAMAAGGSLVRVSHATLFRQGVLVDLLNPKTALFFLAFLPGFVEPQNGAVALQVAVLGGCFVVLAALTDGAYAVVAARIGRGVRPGRLAATSAGTYGLLGVAALAGGV
jgi:threonine/homoserine/homoserine lactone efflux protein